MVGGEEGLAAAPQFGIHQMQRRFVVTVVEGEERQQAGESAREAGSVLGAEGLKLAAEEARGQTARPLVEIAEHEARAAQGGLAEDLGIHEPFGLEAALHVAGAEMHVEEMNQAAWSDFDFGLEDAARLAAAAREVVVARGENGKTRKGEIAVGAAAILAISAELALVAGEGALDLAGLVEVGLARWGVDHFLKAEDVGIEFEHDLHNALGDNAQVKSTRLVDVVSDDAEMRVHHCCRSITQPNSSVARSVTGR